MSEGMLRSGFVAALLVGSVGCAHGRPCPADGTVLASDQPLRARALKEGAPVCSGPNRPKYLGVWGTSGSPDLVAEVVSNEITVRKGEATLFVVRGPCSDGVRSMPQEDRLVSLQAAISRQRPGSIDVHVAGAESDALAIALGQSLASAGLPVYLSPSDLPERRCTSLEEGYAQAHPASPDGVATATVSGKLSKQGVGDAIRAELPRFERCYSSQLTTRPDLAGMVALHFLITPDGSVGGSGIAVDTVSAGVAECVQEVMRSIRFPAPQGSGIVVVTYPFIFSSK